MKLCSIATCEEIHLCRTYCSRHYWRWWRTGDPLGSKARSGLPGEENPAHKLTEGDIPLIFKLHGEGYSNLEIGTAFEVTRQNIRRVVRRETWRHVQI